jgi:uncharacterized membrane protein
MHVRETSNSLTMLACPIPSLSLDVGFLIGELQCVIAASCDNHNTLCWLVIVSRQGKLRKCYHFTIIARESLLETGKRDCSA